MRHFIDKYHKYFNIYTFVGTFSIFLFFIIIVLPLESAKSVALGLELSPDTSIFYTASRLYAIAESYGVEGRQFYIRQRFTFDLLWPIAYASFLLTASIYFFKHLNLHIIFNHFLWLPILSIIFDYLENMMTALVMFRYPNKTYVIDMLAGVVTLFKWITLGLAFIMLFVWLVMYLYKKLEIKNKK